MAQKEKNSGIDFRVALGSDETFLYEDWIVSTLG